MLTLNLRDFNLWSYSISEIVVVGHYAYIDDTCDEEILDHFINLKNIDAEKELLDNLGLYEFTKGLCGDTLAGMDNWGVSEKEYESLSISDKWQLRKMVASNGRMLALLSADSNAQVRLATLSNLLERQAIGVSLGETNWLDVMVNDSDAEVRFSLASLGKQRHLDALVHDKDADVAAEALLRASQQENSV